MGKTPKQFNNVFNYYENKNLFWFYLLSCGVYFSQGIDGVWNLPIFFYMKGLGFDESKIMFLTSLITIAWIFKPIGGLIIDNSSLSKKTWILLSLIGITCISGVIGLLPVLPIFLLIGLMMVSSTFAAVKDIANDGEMVVVGNKHNCSGKIQSVQLIAITVASVLTGFLGGYIAEHYTYKTAFLLLIPIYLLVIGLVVSYKEDNSGIKIKKTNIFESLKVLFTNKKLLLVCLIIFFYKFSPSFGVPLTFKMTDEFHWSKQFIGILDSISAVVSIGGAILYYHFSTKINMMKWLKISVIIGAFITLCYLVFNPVTAIIYNILFNFTGMFFTLLLLDFFARNTISGQESVSFALLCSVSNLANFCNNLSGAYLYDIIGINGLIIIASFSSFLCLPFIKKLNI